jgi:hypothetical protein
MVGSGELFDLTETMHEYRHVTIVCRYKLAPSTVGVHARGSGKVMLCLVLSCLVRSCLSCHHNLMTRILYTSVCLPPPVFRSMTTATLSPSRDAVRKSLTKHVQAKMHSIFILKLHKPSKGSNVQSLVRMFNPWFECSILGSNVQSWCGSRGPLF